MTTERLHAWRAVYEQELLKAVQIHPEEYAYGAAGVPAVVDKMLVAFARGSFNKEGRAVRQTCKALGIKHTYQEITRWLQS